MPEQFTVPQFIDAEDKILGPITARQFVILMITALVDVVLYKLLSFVAFLAVGIPLVVAGGIVAFVKINGQPFHFFVLNLIQTFRRPQLRVRDKMVTDQVPRAILFKKETLPPLPPPRKAPLSMSRLSELTLVVNTGGVYSPDS